MVSASAEMKKITNIGKSGSQYQPNSPKRPSCASTMALKIERACAEQHGDDDETDRDFVGDHLRRRAQRREEGVFRVRRPARHDHAVDLQARDGEDEENADIEIGDLPALGDRHDGPGREREPRGDERREQEDALIGAGRNDRLLEHEFQQIGEGLPQSPRADHVRPAPHLHRRPDLAVGVEQKRHDEQKDDEERDALRHDQRERQAVARPELSHRCRSPCRGTCAARSSSP